MKLSLEIKSYQKKTLSRAAWKMKMTNFTFLDIFFEFFFNKMDLEGIII